MKLWQKKFTVFASTYAVLLFVLCFWGPTNLALWFVLFTNSMMCLGFAYHYFWHNQTSDTFRQYWHFDESKSPEVTPIFESKPIFKSTMKGTK